MRFSGKAESLSERCSAYVSACRYGLRDWTDRPMIEVVLSLEETFPTVGAKGKVLAANERFAADLSKAGLK
jgi:hypothetical protein